VLVRTVPTQIETTIVVYSYAWGQKRHLQQEGYVSASSVRLSSPSSPGIGPRHSSCIPRPNIHVMRSEWINTRLHASKGPGP